MFGICNRLTFAARFSFGFFIASPSFSACIKLETLCPFAVYYLRYAVTWFFTMSRIPLVDGKRAGQKVHRKIAGAVQNVKTPLLFIPLF